MISYLLIFYFLPYIIYIIVFIALLIAFLTLIKNLIFGLIQGFSLGDALIFFATFAIFHAFSKDVKSGKATVRKNSRVGRTVCRDLLAEWNEMDQRQEMGIEPDIRYANYYQPADTLTRS
jgi:hypothetical protein